MPSLTFFLHQGCWVINFFIWETVRLCTHIFPEYVLQRPGRESTPNESSTPPSRVSGDHVREVWLPGGNKAPPSPCCGGIKGDWEQSQDFCHHSALVRPLSLEHQWRTHREPELTLIPAVPGSPSPSGEAWTSFKTGSNELILFFLWLSSVN
jgi:hypothetical protein